MHLEFSFLYKMMLCVKFKCINAINVPSEWNSSPGRSIALDSLYLRISSVPWQTRLCFTVLIFVSRSNEIIAIKLYFGWPTQWKFESYFRKVWVLLHTGHLTAAAAWSGCCCNKKGRWRVAKFDSWVCPFEGIPALAQKKLSHLSAVSKLVEFFAQVAWIWHWGL